MAQESIQRKFKRTDLPGKKYCLTARSGFTIIEMSVVIIIMGLVMMTVLPALNTVRSANQMSLTQSNLRSLMLATAAYVQANGCLPCPAIPGETRSNFGKLGYYTATYTPPTPIACGNCNAVAEGIPPFVALGIPASTARDGWGHWITMRVDPALTTLPSNKPNCAASNTCSVFVPPTAVCTATPDISNSFCTQANTSSKGLCASGLSKANRITVTTPLGAGQQAAVIFVSHGASGYGAFVAEPRKSGFLLPFPSTYAACNAPYDGFAQCNSAKMNSTQFYEAPTATGNEGSYDNILAYADRNALVSMLGNGACSTAW